MLPPSSYTEASGYGSAYSTSATASTAAGGYSNAGGGTGAGLGSAGGLAIAGAFASAFAQFGAAYVRNKEMKHQAKLRMRQFQINEALEANRVARLLQSQRAVTAASGITSAGSPLKVAQETMRQYRTDRSVREYNAVLGAEFMKYGAKQAFTQGNTQAASTMGQGFATASAYSTIGKK